MTWTYTAGATALDNVRLLITDTDATNPIFTDEEITAFLTLNSDGVLYAAAMALETIGSSEVLVLKVIRLLDLQTDGASVSRELRMRAGVLRDIADKAGQTFDIAEMPGLDQFAGYEYLVKEAQRYG